MTIRSIQIERLEDALVKLEKALINNRRDYINGLRIHDRAKSALLGAGYTTVGRVIDAGVTNLIDLKNVGISTIEKLFDELHNEYMVCPPDTNRLEDIIRYAAKGVKNADIVMLRFGAQQSKPMTLKEIGDSRNMTRERVRQIEVEAVMTMLSGRQGKQLRDIVLRRKAGDVDGWESVAGKMTGADKALRILIKAV